MRGGPIRQSDCSRASDSEKLVLAVAFGLTAGYAASLASTFAAHIWILDAKGHPVVDDFVAFWSAGRLALRGTALAAYDPRLEHAAEIATVGHRFAETLGWSYPPLFLFVAAALASIPYVPAFLLWCVTTVALYARVVAAVAGRSAAFLVACGAPWTLLALMPGQNGFLTATLIGLALLHLERRPILGGVFLGLLSYKPQFGILFPLALMVCGNWRAFAAAVVVTLASNGLAAAIFGMETPGAFLHSLTLTTQSHLTHAGLGWSKLQSAYGLARAAGASGAAAWTAQLAATGACALAVFLTWRGPYPYALKAAVLATASVLATPYVFIYDLPVLSIAMAFLFRHRSFDSAELAMLTLATPSVFAFLWLPFPSAFFASVAVGVIVFKRCWAEVSRDRVGLGWAREASPSFPD
jgi:hypothetical protein